MKLIKILAISFCIIIIFSQNIIATGVDDIISTGQDWMSTGRNHAGIGMNTVALQEGSGALYNLLLTLATAAAIIVGAILGIRYMTAGIEEKVQVKESLFPYIISCVVVFGAFGIWKLVVTIMQQII